MVRRFQSLRLQEKCGVTPKSERGIIPKCRWVARSKKPFDIAWADQRPSSKIKTSAKPRRSKIPISKNFSNPLFSKTPFSKIPMARSSGDTPKTFEAALAELEALVARMEAGQMSLEESIAAYKRGKQLEAFCQSQLQAVQEQLKVLEGGELKPLKLAAGSAGADSGSGSNSDSDSQT
jgi:exodeoxyribonuclease VII small subunit